MTVDLDNASTASGEAASVSSSGNQTKPAAPKKKRNLPGMPGSCNTNLNFKLNLTIKQTHISSINSILLVPVNFIFLVRTDRYFN